jgi:hypothetical protein
MVLFLLLVTLKQMGLPEQPHGAQERQATKHRPQITSTLQSHDNSQLSCRVLFPNEYEYALGFL